MQFNWLIATSAIIVIVGLAIIITYKIKEKIRVMKIVKNYMETGRTSSYKDEISDYPNPKRNLKNLRNTVTSKNIQRRYSFNEVVNDDYHTKRKVPSLRPNTSAVNINRTNSGTNLKNICTYCQKKAGGLSLYSKGNGVIIGVCSQCKAQAERQALVKI